MIASGQLQKLMNQRHEAFPLEREFVKYSKADVDFAAMEARVLAQHMPDTSDWYTLLAKRHGVERAEVKAKMMLFFHTPGPHYPGPEPRAREDILRYAELIFGPPKVAD